MEKTTAPPTEANGAPKRQRVVSPAGAEEEHKADGTTPSIIASEEELRAFTEEEAAAEALIPVLGKLYRRTVVCTLFGQPLANSSIFTLLKLHESARRHINPSVSIVSSLMVARTLSELYLKPMRVDIGKLVVSFKVSLPALCQCLTNDMRMRLLQTEGFQQRGQ